VSAAKEDARLWQQQAPQNCHPLLPYQLWVLLLLLVPDSQHRPPGLGRTTG
jgi:hypothetical protein